MSLIPVIVIKTEDVKLFDDPPDGFVEPEVLMLHNEPDRVSSFAAYSTVPGVGRKLEPHRGMLVIVHKALALPVIASRAAIAYQQPVGHLKDTAVMDLVQSRL